MLSGVRKVLSFFNSSSVELDQNQILPSSEEVDSDYIRDTGFITFLNDEYGLIDDKLYFPKVAHRGKALAVGDRVTYLSCRDKEKNSPGKIISVAEFVDLNSLNKVLENDCVEHRSIDRVSLNYANVVIAKGSERVVNGKISKKVGKRIFISPLNIHCDLDKIQSDFIPTEGDWVSVKTELVSYPFGDGQKLRVVKLEPILVKLGIGAVTLLKDNGEGVIENEITFKEDVFEFDFKPTLGHPVKYSAIESDQKRYKWRALAIQNPTRRKTGEKQKKKNTTRFKNGILIKGKHQFGPMALDDTEELVVEVKNNGKIQRILSHCSFPNGYISQVQLREPKDPANIVFEPGHVHKFIFECKARFLGVGKEVFEFYFRGFKIDHLFSVSVTLANEMKAMSLPEESPSPPQVHPKKNTYLYKNFDFSDAFYGMKAVHRTRYADSSSKRSSNYIVPEELFKILLGDPELCKTRKHSHVIQTVLKHIPSLERELNMPIYRERFHTLLYFEEIEDRILYRKYDLHNAVLRKKDNFLVLGIPRIVEDKIVLGVGTQVIVTQPWSETNKGKQVGYIHEYRDHEILISFHESFERSYDGTECDIMFQPSRTTYIRSHAAVDAAADNLGSSWLFPKELIPSPPICTFGDESDTVQGLPIGRLEALNMDDLECIIDENGFVLSPEINEPITIKEKDIDMGIKWFNKNLNIHQKRAVRYILEGRGRTIPYVIQGPPGTGKTVTVVELVIQIYTLISNSRIIIATPSNSAADLVCQKLVQSGNFSPGQMVRLLSYGRLLSGNFPEEIAPFCTSTQDEVHMLQPDGYQGTRFLNMNECLGSERIVIGTCCTLATLHEHGLKRGHFTHIIIDEAAQCTEPESLIPMNFLSVNKGQVVLTGDTEQLGPISINFLSMHFGFSKSFMQRINELKPYVRNREKFPKTDGFDPRCVTRLRYNYRSVPGILRLPNMLFYDSELIPTLSPSEGRMAKIIRKFNNYVGNPNNSSPMLFHGLCSENIQEENNFSWYNPQEIWQTVCYLRKLYDLTLTPDDIGIITPYQKQVEKLRHMLNGMKVPLPKIGSVEEFQGQERLVIILSTVRGNAKQVESKENMIGFLSSPRRLNVAITRARALLIIIGNPYSLAADTYWSQVIKYCVKNSFYIGCPLGEGFSMSTLSDELIS